ncbi:MAG: glycosyltransferase [Thermoplasmata archaeon]
MAASDVVYFNYQAGGLEAVLLALQVLNRVPVIAGHHGALQWYTSEPHVEHIKLLFAALGPRDIRIGRHLAAQHVTNTRDLALLKRFGVTEYFQIPSAISCDEFGSQVKRRSFTMAFAGSFAPQKGVDLLPEIVRLARERIPDAAFEFCGDGPFRAFLTEFGSDPNVRYLGFVTPRQKRELLASAHVYLLPSRHETFSKSAMEALASGTPVVAMRVAGVEDYVVSGQNGFIVDTLAEFARAVDAVHSLWSGDLAGYERMSLKCLDTAREYDWSAVGPKLDSMISRVAKAST